MGRRGGGGERESEGRRGVRGVRGGRRREMNIIGLVRNWFSFASDSYSSICINKGSCLVLKTVDLRLSACNAISIIEAWYFFHER